MVTVSAVGAAIGAAPFPMVEYAAEKRDDSAAVLPAAAWLTFAADAETIAALAASADASAADVAVVDATASAVSVVTRLQECPDR